MHCPYLCWTRSRRKRSAPPMWPCPRTSRWRRIQASLPRRRWSSMDQSRPPSRSKSGFRCAALVRSPHMWRTFASSGYRPTSRICNALRKGPLPRWRQGSIVRLLIVEDDLRLCDVLRRGLAEQGHVVDQVHDGEEGERFAVGGSYDALIVDINIPVRDGL